MSDYITAINPITLADYESLITDPTSPRKKFLHTIRDYMPFFHNVPISMADKGDTVEDQMINVYPEGELHNDGEGWGDETVVGNTVAYTACQRSSSNSIETRKLERRSGAEQDQWRLNRDETFAIGFARAVVRDIFYGDPAKNPKVCKGFFNIVSPKNKAFKDRIINAGGKTADKQTEIALIGWDPAYTFMFYPKKDKEQAKRNSAGFEVDVHEDPIRVSLEREGKPKHFWAYETDFHWEYGLSIFDARSVVRITNLDTSLWTKVTMDASAPDLINILTQAYNMLPTERRGRCAFYMNDDVTSLLTRQVGEKSNAFWTPADIKNGVKFDSFHGVPIIQFGTDVMTSSGAVVTGV